MCRFYSGPHEGSSDLEVSNLALDLLHSAFLGSFLQLSGHIVEISDPE